MRRNASRGRKSNAGGGEENQMPLNIIHPWIITKPIRDAVFMLFVGHVFDGDFSQKCVLLTHFNWVWNC